MTAESAVRFEALEEQADRIMGVFARAGYERVAPSFIQPADIFLDRIGEALRNRTYVFTDPDGQELCLRPDLTIPAARIYMAVSYTHLRAHETRHDLVCRLLLEK